MGSKVALSDFLEIYYYYESEITFNDWSVIEYPLPQAIQSVYTM